jgi:rhamnulose-1-phosphate aldolase
LRLRSSAVRDYNLAADCLPSGAAWGISSLLAAPDADKDTVMRHAIRLSRELERVVDAVSEVARHLWQKGWAERNAGNISVDVTESTVESDDAVTPLPPVRTALAYPELGGRFVLVSGAGARLRDLASTPIENACILRLSEAGDQYRVVWGGEVSGFEPTSELAAHLAIHGFLRRRGALEMAVVHTHPNELIALTHMAEYADGSAVTSALWAMLPEVKILLPEGVALVPYHRPGSQELAQATVTALARHRVCLWEKHGCLAVAGDVREAFDLIDVANKSAQILLTCRGAGVIPQGLSGAQLEELERFFAPREREV